MEITAIRKLIETDEATRKRIEAVNEQKKQLQATIDAKKKDLHDSLWKQTNEKLEQEKSELELKAASAAKDNNNYFEIASEQLNKQFYENKDRWKNELVKRILEN